MAALGRPRASIGASDGVKIGVLTDMSGIFSDNTGPGMVMATRMAVEDFGGSVEGRPIEVIFADHQNKPDVAAAIARDWIATQSVDVIVDAVGDRKSVV